MKQHTIDIQRQCLLLVYVGREKKTTEKMNRSKSNTANKLNNTRTLLEQVTLSLQQVSGSFIVTALK